MSEQDKKIKYSEILVTRKDLPLSCPIKQTWDGHPKIYLNILERKMIKCPYCGIKYRLVD
ncbi:MAG: zinc-finger domain-containing protein [Candidatus Riesia sp.]|nr:zinc-finger domain-containing protein [Candidatus Riesia sp.]